MLCNQRRAESFVTFKDLADTDSDRWQLCAWSNRKDAARAANLYPEDLTVIVPMCVIPAGHHTWRIR